MAILILSAAMVSVSLGVALVWANSERFTNQAFAVLAVVVGARLFCLASATLAGEKYSPEAPVPMLRAAAVLSMLTPWLLWVTKESLASGERGRLETLKRSFPWLIIGVVLAVLCCSNSFYNYPDDGAVVGKRHGNIYVPVNVTLAGVYSALIVQSWLQMRRQAGIRRIEMQFLVLNSGLVALVAIGIAIVGHYVTVPALKALNHCVIILGCALTAWAVTYYRIFNARQVLVSLIQRVVVIALLAASSFICVEWLSDYLPRAVAYCSTIVAWSALCFSLERRSRKWLGLDGESLLERMRREVIALARTEPDPDTLRIRFTSYLGERSESSSVELMFENGEVHQSASLEFTKFRAGYSALSKNGWATPESIVRRRYCSERADLRDYLVANCLGLLVSTPRGSFTPTLLIAFRTKRNGWPFTYPEVVIWQNIAELMDNILTRSRLNMQAAERARTQHLEMMSRGLAHDLNNLITPIATFLTHVSEKHAGDFDEREVQEAAKRSVRVMVGYIQQALLFADRTALSFEAVDVGQLLHEVVGLVSTRASVRGVTVVERAEFNGKITADTVLLQRLLVNIVCNAIDASTRAQEVTVRSTLGRRGWVCLSVSDSGEGIAPENMEKIFEPYFTTKRYGDDSRGFGLGLTTSQKIAQLHGGLITVSSQLGQGAIFTIDLPVDQLQMCGNC